MQPPSCVIAAAAGPTPPRSLTTSSAHQRHAPQRATPAQQQRLTSLNLHASPAHTRSSRVHPRFPAAPPHYLCFMQARSVDQRRPAASAAVEQRARRRLLHHVHHTLLAPGSLPAMPDAAHTHRVEVARQPAVPAGLAGSRSGSWRSRRRRRLPPPPSPRSRSRPPPPRRRGGGPDRRGGLRKGRERAEERG